MESRPETGCDCFLIRTIIAGIGQQIKLFFVACGWVCVCVFVCMSRHKSPPAVQRWHFTPTRKRLEPSMVAHTQSSILPFFYIAVLTLRAFHYAINRSQFTKHSASLLLLLLLLQKIHSGTPNIPLGERERVALNQILKLLNFPRVHANGWGWKSNFSRYA